MLGTTASAIYDVSVAKYGVNSRDIGGARQIRLCIVLVWPKGNFLNSAPARYLASLPCTEGQCVSRHRVLRRTVACLG